MGNQQESLGSFDLGWLVGVIESEGCLTIQHRIRPDRHGHYTPLITVSNTNPQMIEKLDRLLTLGRVGHHVRWWSVEHLSRYNRRVKKPQAVVTVWGYGRVRAMLDLVGPQWQCRGEEAQVLREFIDGPTPRSGAFYDGLFEECKRLKRRTESSQTIRQAPTIGDDIVGPSVKAEGTTDGSRVDLRTEQRVSSNGLVREG